MPSPGRDFTKPDFTTGTVIRLLCGPIFARATFSDSPSGGMFGNVRVAVRSSRTEDDRSLADIIRRVMTEFGAVGEGYSIMDPEVDAMHEAYSRPRHALKVVEMDGEVVGLGGIAPLAEGDPNTCELRKMYFLPEARGLGLGRKMLEELLQEAKDAGYKKCYLESLEHMHDARRLYERAGFTLLDAPMGCTGHCRCNVWMTKSLEE